MIFVKKENKTSKNPSYFCQGMPLFFLFFFKKQWARWKPGSTGLRGGSHYSGWASRAPGETLLKVSWAGFWGATPDCTRGTWALSHICLAKSWSGKRQKSEMLGLKGRWVTDKEQIFRYGGPALGNAEMEKKTVWGKLAHIFWSGPFNRQKRAYKGCFCPSNFLST